MSGLIGDWVTTLAGAAVFCAMAMALCPAGKPRRVLTAACACVMCLALLSPAAKPDAGSLAEAFARYDQAAQAVTDDATDASAELERTVIESECEAYIMDRAAALGLDPGEVDVTLRWSEEGFWYPWEFSAALPLAGRERLAEVVESELGVPAERQYWGAAQ